MHQVHRRRFQAGEGHVQGISRHPGPGQGVFCIVAPLGQLLHGPPAGVGKAKHTGDLVEALSRRVVPGGPQDGHVRIAPHVHQHGVSPGDAQRQEGGLQLREGQVVGGDVPPQVVHRDEGLPHGEGGALGEVHPHQQGSDEPRPIGHRHRVDVGPGHPRLRQGPVRQGGNGLHMLAGGDLRHHAAVDGVHVRLGGDGVAEDLPPVPDHRGGGLVAGRFKR